MRALRFKGGLFFLFPVLLSNPSYGVHEGILQNRRDDVRFFPRMGNGLYSTEGMSIPSIDPREAVLGLFQGCQSPFTSPSLTASQSTSKKSALTPVNERPS